MPEISDERLDEILAAAEKATPGPWYQTGAPWFRDGTGVLAGSPDGNVAFLIADTDDFALPRDEYQGFPLGGKEADAAYIAMCDPATISTLIAEVKAARAGKGAEEPVTGDGPLETLSDERLRQIRGNTDNGMASRIMAGELLIARAALASPPWNSEHGGVRAKALEWRQVTSPREDGPADLIAEWEADCVIGTYIIADEGGEWWLRLADLFDTHQVGRSNDPDALRRVAQADYESRILSALEPAVAALTAASVQQGKGEWQPIETAPKDGTEFQAWFEPGVWEPRCRVNPDSEAVEIWGRVGYDQDGWEAYPHIRATHWRPLPAPPATPKDTTDASK